MIITLTEFEHDRPCYVPTTYIDNMTVREDSHYKRFTRIHIKNPNDGFEYDIDVKETIKVIKAIMEAKKNEQAR